MTAKPVQRALFVTGTDTNVGKTHVTCLIARQAMSQGVRVSAYKPVCSGAIQKSPAQDDRSSHHWDDIDRLKAVIGDDWPDDLICPQRFLAAVAPSVAARMEGKSVDYDRLVAGGSFFTGRTIVD